MTPYAYKDYVTQPDIYKFSDDSQIGRVDASAGNSSNYRFFEIQPIKWIVLNYNKGFDESSNTKDGLTVGTMKRYELLTNNILVGGVAADSIHWENNTVNMYLNTTFINESFHKNDVGLVRQSIIYNNTGSSDSNLDMTGSNANYLSNGSNPTIQALYALSAFEVSNSESPYITAGIFKPGANETDANESRLAKATDYAKAHYQFINATTGNSTWWLRTTQNTTNVLIVTTPGYVNGYNASDVHYGTRPAMQVVKNVRFDK